MAILTVANQIEDGETAAAYSSIVEKLPDDITAYFPDVATIVSLLRSVADEITLGDAVTVNRYIVDGVSIADEIILSDALLTVLEETAWEIGELIDDIRYGDDDDYYYDDDDYYDDDYEYDFADEDDGEMYAFGDEDDEYWDEWYRISGSFTLEYYNGEGMYRKTEYYSDGDAEDTSLLLFGKKDGKYYFEDRSSDYSATSYSLEISAIGFTCVKTTEEFGEYPSRYENKLDVVLAFNAPNDVGVSVVKTSSYYYVYDEWDEETGDPTTLEASGADVTAKTVNIKAIGSFTNKLESEVEENRYDITDLSGLFDIYSDVMNSKYGLYIEMILSNLFGGGEEEEW